MSDFTDLFSSMIESRGEHIESQLREFESEGSYGRIKDAMEERYTSASFEEPEDFRVVACDAGRNSVRLRNNHRFYVAQASAVDDNGGNSRSLHTDVVRPYSSGVFSHLMSFSSELAELEAVNERLDEIDTDTRTFILIDGSLVTRMLPLPTELEVSSNSEIVLDLIEEFHELIQRVRENEKLVLAGISKDSNSSILNRAVIEELSQQDREELEEGEDELSVAYQEGIPDIALLEESWNGYTQPVKLGAASSRFRTRMEAFRRNRKEYISRNFSSKERALETVKKITDYPGIVSFYWLPGGDQPVRVDLLGDHWNGDSLMEVEGRKFVEERQVMKNLLELLKAGYAGPSRHNVWISLADSQASLSNSEMENVYLPIMSQRLGINLRKYRRRRDKRV
jgi:hypothetical protein